MSGAFFRARLVRNGPAVPVKVFHAGPWVDGVELDRSPRWQALIGTETTARAILMGDDVPIEVDGVTLRNLERIPEHEYRFLVADAEHARDHRPEHPKASPRRAVDFGTIRPPF
jgi:hypothetical protein